MWELHKFSAVYEIPSGSKDILDGSKTKQNKINHDNKIQIEINGDLFNCSLIKDSLYDPTGQKMRS